MKHLKKIVFFFLIASPYLVELQADQKEKIDIGVILPLSGELAPIGEKVRLGIEHSLSPYKDRIKLHFQDGGIDSKTAITAFHHIRAHTKATTIIGPFGPDQTLSLSTIKDSKDFTFIAISSCHEEYERLDNVFCLYPSYQLQLQSMIPIFKNAQGLKEKKMGIYIKESESSEGIRSYLQNFAKEHKIEIAFDETIPTDTSDFRSHLIQAKKADIFFVAAHEPSKVALVFRQLHQLGIRPEYNLWFSEADQEIFKKNARTLEGIYVLGTFDKLESEFIQAFEKATGLTPDLYHGLSADASRTLFQAVTTKKENESIINAIVENSSTQSACKGFRFSSQRKVNLTLQPKQIRNGIMATLKNRGTS